MTNIPKIWFKFSKCINGEKVNFRWESLSRDRFEEFIDFKMEHYVKHEVTHVVAGIYKNPEAMEEYKRIFEKLHKKNCYHDSICCVDDESNKMVGITSLNVYTRGEVYTDVMPAKTPELQRFFEIIHKWNKLCPVPDILEKYDVNEYFDDGGSAIHTDYRGYGLSYGAVITRQFMSEANNIPMTGAWITSPAMLHVTEREGWETIYELSADKLGVMLGVTFPHTSQRFAYKVKNFF